MEQKQSIVERLIAKVNEEEKAGPERKSVFVPALGVEIECEQLELDDVLDLMDRYGTDQSRKSLEFQRELIYMSCKLFRSEKLQKGLNIGDPVSVVKKVLGRNFDNYNVLTSTILSMNGLGDVEEQVKN